MLSIGSSRTQDWVVDSDEQEKRRQRALISRPYIIRRWTRVGRDTTGATGKINRSVSITGGQFCDISAVKQPDVAPISCNDRSFTFISRHIAARFRAAFVLFPFPVFSSQTDILDAAKNNQPYVKLSLMRLYEHTLAIAELWAVVDVAKTWLNWP